MATARSKWKFEVTQWIVESAVLPTEYGIKAKHPIHTKGVWAHISKNKQVQYFATAEEAAAELKIRRKRFNEKNP